MQKIVAGPEGLLHRLGGHLHQSPGHNGSPSVSLWRDIPAVALRRWGLLGRLFMAHILSISGGTFTAALLQVTKPLLGCQLVFWLLFYDLHHSLQVPAQLGS